ncbi:hypothetical protein M378DRAFT_178662 [Amanita muscaria Koide BX008]|uniref:Uncharacterized protein n=1 Tax=Amanita muscaria (strain Koide BX008) TaxID=946122 RepID=A0A0C2X616_AMAMK|nr:hypothetical protein M378DRAFT_178662 [Amanita muscaria Koide BX008]
MELRSIICTNDILTVGIFSQDSISDVARTFVDLARMTHCHWQARQINYMNSLLTDFEAAVLQRESVAPVYSRLIALSSLVNPGLNIDGQGTIEFPVPMQDLIPQLIGDRPKPDNGSQGEIESKYVRFDNPNWEQFLRDVLSDTNGSSVQEHAVRFEFRKLVLFDSGESYLPRSCYADDNDNSGILLVFLPPKSSAKEAGGIDYRLVLYYKLTFPSKVDFTNALYAEDNLWSIGTEANIHAKMKITIAFATLRHHIFSIAYLAIMTLAMGSQS